MARLKTTALSRGSGTIARGSRAIARPLRMASIRGEDSARLDSTSHIPFVRWGEFLSRFDFQQGEHVTLVGTTGSGKTTLAQRIILEREYVVVLATKPRDSSLYDPLVREGFVITDKFDPSGEQPRVIFRPRLDAPTAEAVADQAAHFKTALINIFRAGSWCVYADEVRYLTDNLHLKREFEVLWLQGRSLGVSLIVGTQRPVSIPLLAFDSATHMFLWRNTDYRNIDRMSEFAGTDQQEVRALIPRLPMHEVLYINTRTGEMLRTNVKS